MPPSSSSTPRSARHHAPSTPITPTKAAAMPLSIQPADNRPPEPAAPPESAVRQPTIITWASRPSDTMPHPSQIQAARQPFQLKKFTWTKTPQTLAETKRRGTIGSRVVAGQQEKAVRG
ncbi:hypothetical protein ACLOJK_000942 [Asimina triloba]